MSDDSGAISRRALPTSTSHSPFAPTARELLHRIPGATGRIGSGCHDEAFWRRSAPGALTFHAANVSEG
jgi:hypothetical protein